MSRGILSVRGVGRGEEKFTSKQAHQFFAMLSDGPLPRYCHRLQCLQNQAMIFRTSLLTHSRMAKF